MIPAQFDYRTTGTTSFSAEAPIGPGGSCSFEPQCNAVVTNTNNGFINQTGSMNVCGITALGSFSVPTTGTLHFECNFGPGMTINSVSFTSPAP